LGRKTVDPPQKDAEDDHRPADYADVAQRVFPAHADDQAAEHDERDGGENQVAGEQGIGTLPSAAQEVHRSPPGGGGFGVEIDNHGENRAQVYRDVERDILVASTVDLVQKREMRRGGNRQELRQPLDDCE